MLISEIVLRSEQIHANATRCGDFSRSSVNAKPLLPTTCFASIIPKRCVKQTIKAQLLRFSEMSRCSFSQPSKMVLNEICSQFVSFPLLVARSAPTAATASKKRKEEKSINFQWATEKLVQRRSRALDEFTLSEICSFPLAIWLSFASEWSAQLLDWIQLVARSAVNCFGIRRWKYSLSNSFTDPTWREWNSALAIDTVDGGLSLGRTYRLRSEHRMQQSRLALRRLRPELTPRRSAAQTR